MTAPGGASLGLRNRAASCRPARAPTIVHTRKLDLGVFAAECILAVQNAIEIRFSRAASSCSVANASRVPPVMPGIKASTVVWHAPLVQGPSMARPFARALGHPVPLRWALRSRPWPESRTRAAVVSLRFALPHATLADAHVVDLAGTRVRTLACGELLAGEHEIGWDGLDEAGTRCRSGRYVLRLETGDRLLTSRVVTLA